MKKTVIMPHLILLTFVSFLSSEQAGQPGIQTRAMKLESGILSKVDGIFFTGDTIGPILRYQNNLRDFLIGVRINGQRVPQYSFQGKKYTMQELSRIETASGHAEELDTLLRQIRSDFETLSVEFRGIARGTKSFMAVLVEESCARRDRLNSLLYTWAKTDVTEEERLFDDHVHTMKDLEMFFIDLHNFLGDLMVSCPKASRQFNEKVAKYKKIKGYLAELGIPKKMQESFLKQINHSLATVTLDNIDRTSVKTLFDEFKKSN